MKKKVKKKGTINNDLWIKNHFEKIVNRYAGQHIIVCCEEIFTGEGALEKAKRKHPHAAITSMPVPRPEDFTHILRIWPPR